MVKLENTANIVSQKIASIATALTGNVAGHNETSWVILNRFHINETDNETRKDDREGFRDGANPFDVVP